MVIGISHKDLDKLRKDRGKKKVGNRKNRSTLLSSKTRTKMMQQFDQDNSKKAKDENIEIDEHVKLNDNYMRTGKYVPKKK